MDIHFEEEEILKRRREDTPPPLNRYAVNLEIDMENEDFKPCDKERASKRLIKFFPKMTEYFSVRKNQIGFFQLFLAILFYILSLRGCPQSMTECLKNFDENFALELAYCLIISSMMITSIFIFVLHRLLSWKYLIMVIFSFGYLCFFYDTGSNLVNHGAFNRIGLFTFILLFYLVVSVIILMIKIICRYPVAACVSIITISLYTYYTMSNIISNSCSTWNQGLKGAVMDFTGDPCIIKTPDRCDQQVLNGKLDFNKLFGINCEAERRDDRSYFDNVLSAQNKEYQPATQIGVPRVENYSFSEFYYSSFQKKVVNSFFDYNSPLVSDDLKEKTEIIIDYSEEKSKVKINIKRNEERVKEIKEILKTKSINTPVKNVIVIYIDAVSRNQFHMKMERVRSFIDKFYKTNHSKYSSYQFLKHHAMAFFTTINTFAAFFGQYWQQPNKGTNFFNHFKENGYITGHIITQCHKDIMDVDDKIFEDFNFGTYDHAPQGLFCDPNYYDLQDPYAPFKGPYSLKLRCLHGRQVNEYAIEYADKFWKAYPDVPKVLRMGFIDAHEPGNEQVRNLDKNLAKFLEDFETAGHLDNTFLLFMSDHGNNMLSYFDALRSPDFAKEKFLATLFMVAPNSMDKALRDGLESNEQSITTHYDVYNTLVELSGSPRDKHSNKGQSLFSQIDNKRFTCSKFDIDPKYCVCEPRHT